MLFEISRVQLVHKGVTRIGAVISGRERETACWMRHFEEVSLRLPQFWMEGCDVQCGKGGRMQEGSGLGSGASLRWTDEGVRPYVIFGVAILGAPGGWAENAICVLTLSWVGGCGARGRDRSSREAGGRNGHRGWRSHLPNA
jgi:hypothetical protein